MFKKEIYKYKNGDSVILSPHKPECEYELMYRLISNSDEHLLTKDFRNFTTCIDILEKDIELWHEVHISEVTTDVTTLKELEERVTELEKFKEIVMAMVQS